MSSLSRISITRPKGLSLRQAAGPALGAVLLLAALAPLFLGSYELNLLGRFLSLSILTIGLVVLWGEGGILSLGQGVFFGLGAYVLAMHMTLAGLGDGQIPDFMMWSGRESLPWWWKPFANPVVALLGVVLVPALFAVALAWPIFHRRISGVYFSIITQALALAFATLLVSQQDSTGGFNGLTGFQTLLGFDLLSPGTGNGIYWITLALTALALITARWLLGSRYGSMLRATRDGQNRVRFLGYNPVPYRLIAFGFAAALAGVAGALFTLHSDVISPAMVGVVPSIEMVVWAAVGGRNSLIGAIIGTLLISYLKDIVSSSFPDFWLYGLGLTFIVIVTLLPRGIAGLLERRARKAETPEGAAE